MHVCPPARVRLALVLSSVPVSLFLLIYLCECVGVCFVLACAYLRACVWAPVRTCVSVCVRPNMCANVDMWVVECAGFASEHCFALGSSVGSGLVGCDLGQ